MSDIGLILQSIGTTLVTKVAPALEGRYEGGNAGISGMLAVMAGEAWDSAADRLSREIETMRALLMAGGVEITTQADSLKLTDLQAVRNALADELITLQARIETETDEASKALNAQIWGFFIAGAAERMPSLPEFPET